MATDVAATPEGGKSNRMRRPPPLGLLATVVVAAAIGVAACGGTSSPAPGTSSPGPPGSPDASAPAGSDAAPSTPAPTRTPAATPSATATPGPAGTPAPQRSPEYESPEDLEVGVCYDPIVDPDDGSLLAAIILPCAEPHIAEVFGVAALAGAPTAPYPGIDDIEAEAEDLCDAAFEEYVGIDFDRSRLGYIYYTPTEGTWAAGDREVLCVIDDDGDAMTGSVKGTRR